MTLLHSASKGHLLSAFPYGQDLLPPIAIRFLVIVLQLNPTYHAGALFRTTHSCLRTNNEHRFSTRGLMTFPCLVVILVFNFLTASPVHQFRYDILVSRPFYTIYAPHYQLHQKVYLRQEIHIVILVLLNHFLTAYF